MAQKQFLSYKDPVNSLPLAEKDLGIMRPGRYSGFDEYTFMGSTLTVNHSSKIQKVDSSGNLINFGAFRTPRGIIFHDDSPVVILTPPPFGMSYFALLIAEHNYQEIAGGTAANYQILVGDENNYPSITDPTKQCIIGRLQVTATDVSGTYIDYTPEPAPLLGDGEMVDYLNNIPYATTSVNGLVKKSNLNYQGQDPYNNYDTYISARQLAETGITQTINIPTLQSSVSTPGWVTQEITSAFGVELYKLNNIINFDINWNEVVSGQTFIRSLKSGYYPAGNILIGTAYPEPTIALPQLKIDTVTKKAWIMFWSKHNANIPNVKLNLVRKL